MSFLVGAARLLSIVLTLGFSLPAAGVLFAPTSLQAQETAPISVTLANLERVYTGANQALDPATDLTISPGTAADYTFKVTYPGRTSLPRNAGSYAVKVVATAKTTPALSATATGTLLIAKAPLLVTADDQVRFYGVANPKLTLSYEGFLGADTSSVLDHRPTATTLAKPTSPADLVYDITVTGGSDNNYSLYGYNTGRLTIIPAYPGTYEAFLYDFDSADQPVGKLSLTLPSVGSTFSGRLELIKEGVVLPLSGKLQPNESLTGAIGSASRKASATSDTYRVDFAITSEGLTAELFVTEYGTNEAISSLTIPAFSRLSPYTSAEPFTGAGTYTFALLNPSPANPVELSPAGLSFATATIDAKGTLKLSGKFADGATLTASAVPDSELRYRLFLRPYGSRKDSYAIGDLVLKTHPDADLAELNRYYVPLSSAHMFYWRKAPKPSGTLDTLFPAGFGPISHQIVLDPWTPPAKAKAATTTTAEAIPAITLAQRLGLVADNANSGFASFEYGAEDLGDSVEELPGAIEFTVANKALPVLVPPSTNPRAWKITSFNTANGRFAGSFKLLDTITATGKPYTRTVTFQGILRQPPVDNRTDDTTLGVGYFILKPVPGNPDTSIRSVDFHVVDDL